jgi:hypothetical protein
MIAAWRLAAKGDESHHQQLEWHGAQVQESAKCFHEAAQLLADPQQTSLTLSRCLQSIVRFAGLLRNEIGTPQYRNEPRRGGLATR